jgi:hypothetical protein
MTTLASATIKEAAAGLAQRAALARQEKQAITLADLQNFGKGLYERAQPALQQFWNDPQYALARKSLAGAGIGGAAGLASSYMQPRERRDNFGRAMTGAMLGGLGGVGWHYAPQIAKMFDESTDKDKLYKEKIRDYVGGSSPEVKALTPAEIKRRDRLAARKSFKSRSEWEESYPVTSHFAQTAVDHPGTVGGVAAIEAGIGGFIGDRASQKIDQFANKYYASPAKTVPGMSDQIAGIQNEEIRKALQDYTSSASDAQNAARHGIPHVPAAQAYRDALTGGVPEQLNLIPDKQTGAYLPKHKAYDAKTIAAELANSGRAKLPRALGWARNIMAPLGAFAGAAHGATGAYLALGGGEGARFRNEALHNEAYPFGVDPIPPQGQ